MKRTRLAMVAFVAASLLTACGSNGGGGAAGGSGNVDITPFQDAAAAAMKSTPNTWKGPTEPAKPKPGIKLALITCDALLQGCTIPLQVAQQEAKKFGWTTTFYDGKSQATTQNKDILQALASGVDGILISGADPTGVQSGLAEAKKLNVPVISVSLGLSDPNPEFKAPAGQLNYAFDVMNNMPALGKALGNWIVADSKGKAHVQFFLDKEFYNNVVWEQAVHQVLKKCSSCVVEPDETFIAANTSTSLGSQTVSVLQRRPKVDYVVTSYDPAATFQVPAIKQAGLANRIKLVSVLGNAPNLNYIKDGEVQAADGGFDSVYMGYASLDQMIRLLNGQQPIKPYDENLPIVLITKDNLPTGFDPKLGWTQTAYDYKSEFEKLWGLS